MSEDQYHDWSNKYNIFLNGVDNLKTRRSVDSNRFKIFLDGGTNGTLELFDSFTLRNFSVMEKAPTEIWRADNSQEQILHKNL